MILNPIHIKKLTILFLLLFYQQTLLSNEMPMSPDECDKMTVWDFETGSCKPLAMAGMPMNMWMIHGNAFLVQNIAEKPRGRNQFASPHWLMGDLGSSFGDRHYINVNLMITAEKWTLPKRGYPELLQIGEDDEDGNPYVDGQHPHSSPIMGITLSDTISLGGIDNLDHLKLSFSPRGQATEGPIAFMHRATGIHNPDAPLGHHVAQDVSHISSTVLAASLRINRSTIQTSIFHGEEPEPTEVDLPIGKLNSFGVRYIHEFSDRFFAMASAAFIKEPEHDDPTLDRVDRYSASLYYDKEFSDGFMFQNTVIMGLTNFYDHYSKLRSFGEEFLFYTKDLPYKFWGRVEILERGLAQLQILSADDIKWVSALTVGYTYDLLQLKFASVGIGLSVTKNFIPSSIEGSYGTDPIAGKVFIQLMGMKMGNY